MGIQSSERVIRCRGARMLKHRMPYPVTVFILLAVSACVIARADTHAKEGLVSSPLVMEYRIGPSDMLSISVWKHDDMDRTVTVRPDGMISYPLLGDMHAAGLTPIELRETLVKRLKEYMDITSREVSVVVDEVHSYTVSVLGEVNAPGRFEFQSQVTVLDALAEAGGLTEFASRSGIIILRPVRDGINRIRFNYENVLASGGEEERLSIYPGDIILVP